MSQLSAILRDADDNRLLFQCPGCGSAHGVWVGTGSGPRWTWNADVDAPTFRPSILVRWDHWVPPWTPENPDPGPQSMVSEVCHSYVTDGQIQFLGDCTHALAGQTVPLPYWDAAP